MGMNSNGQFKMPARFSVAGPDITWAGRNPFDEGLCLGFDNGTIMLTDPEAGVETAHQAISPSGNAINGVASIGKKVLRSAPGPILRLSRLRAPERLFGPFLKVARTGW